jgi:four helix bundle protein
MPGLPSGVQAGPQLRVYQERWLPILRRAAGRSDHPGLLWAPLRVASRVQGAGKLQPVVRRIERADRDLARQLRRCSASVALNVTEGMYSRGGNRNVRYHSAHASARETLACLEVAETCSLVAPLDAELHGQLNRIIGTLVKLVAA